MAEKYISELIKFNFIGLNEYTNANRKNKYAGAGIKKKLTKIFIDYFIDKKPLKNFPIRVGFIWHLKDKRKDLDNIDFQKKFILDGMVEAGFIPNDGLKFIGGFGVTDYKVSGFEGVEILIDEMS